MSDRVKDVIVEKKASDNFLASLLFSWGGGLALKKGRAMSDRKFEQRKN